MERKIPKRIASTLINALKGGVVPRVGLPYITVGREKEIDAFVRDIDIIAQGGASFRFLSGKYGSGKSFMLQTVRSYAMDRGFVVADADLSPERRLHGTKGQGLATYRELIGNLAVKTRPEGGALTLVLEKWISRLQSEAMSENGLRFDDERLAALTEKKINEVINSLSEMVHGFDFCKLLTLYYRAYLAGDDEGKAAVVKWFRAEYPTKGEAKAQLGVNIIITDDDWYEYIKLFSLFFKLAGYSGFLVLIDELVNLYKIPHTVARQYNYEKILTMYNDTMQGKSRYLGIVMSGTPQCIKDTRRGIYSYEALRSRLEQGRFSSEGLCDMLSPVIELQALSYEEMLVLTEKLTDIHAVLYDYRPRITQDELITFIKIEFSRIGADKNITPREVIRDFIELLNILMQNPGTDVQTLLCSEQFAYSQNEIAAQPVEPMFAEFEV